MKDLKEKTTRTELIFNGRFLKVWRDEVELSNGYTSFREYIKHPGAACVVPVLPNGNLLMVKQWRHALKQVFLEFPAGKCDKGETSEVTAVRELEEETGYHAKALKFLTHIHPVIGYSDEQIDLYVASDLHQTVQHLDTDEIMELVEVSVEELKEKIQAGQVTDVKTQIAAFWYFQTL